VWSRKPDILRDVLLIKCERLLEHARKLPDLPLERLLIRPSKTRIQQLPRDALNRGRYRQTESTKIFKVGFGKLPRVDGIDDCASVFKRATLACAELAACPAGVDEPAVDFVFRHALGEHLGVAARVEDNERRAIAGGEGRNWF